MKIGVMQYDVKHDKNQNIDKLKTFLMNNKCDIVLLPELSMCGYLFSSRDELLSISESVPSGSTTNEIISLSQKYGCMIIFGLAEKENDKIFNTAVIVNKGEYIGKYRKIHLSNYEKRLFDKGEENKVFEIENYRIGIQICFDLWFPEMSREQRNMRADIFLVLANFGGETTYEISKTRAIENLTPLVLCNRVGIENLTNFDAEFLGKSVVIDNNGHEVIKAKEKEEDNFICNINILRKNENIICSDFDEEINFHYHKKIYFNEK